MSWVLQKMGQFTPKADKACLVPSDSKFCGDFKNFCCHLKKPAFRKATGGNVSNILTLQLHCLRYYLTIINHKYENFRTFSTSNQYLSLSYQIVVFQIYYSLWNWEIPGQGGLIFQFLLEK